MNLRIVALGVIGLAQIAGQIAFADQDDRAVEGGLGAPIADSSGSSGLHVPTVVVAAPDGSFSIDAVFTFGSDGGINGWQGVGVQNATAGPVASCGCFVAVCQRGAGEQFPFTVQGTLIDAQTSGRVQVSFAPCFEPNTSSEVTVQPYQAPAVPLLDAFGRAVVTLSLLFFGRRHRSRRGARSERGARRPILPSIQNT